MAPAKDAEEALPSVPPLQSAGPDGFPVLPSVSTMLGVASQTAGRIGAGAAELQRRAVQVQLESEAKMRRQKVVYEHKLQVQEEKNRLVDATNAEITSEVTVLRANTTAQKNHAKQLHEDNQLMRQELRVLHAKFSVAREFVDTSLAETDDSRAPELIVFQSLRRKSHFPKLLLEVGSHPRADEAGPSDSLDDKQAGLPGSPDDKQADPEDVLVALSKGVTDLQQQQRDSEARLKDMFLGNFQAGTRRHAALVAKQRALNATRTELQALQGRLQVAERHLESTGAGLRRRLRELGLFAQHLAHLALAPIAEAPRLLESLPKAVAAKPTPANGEF